jgi:hypothetical protein
MHPLKEAGPRQRRRWVIPAAVVTALVASTVTTLLIVGGDEDDKGSVNAQSPSSTNAPPDGGSLPTDLSQFAPTDVTARVQDGAVLVRWTDNTGGGASHTITIGAPDAEFDPVFVPAGESFKVLTPDDNVDPSAPLCFLVSAAFFPADADQVKIVGTESGCINGAVVND